MIPVLPLFFLVLVGGFCGWIYYRREFAVPGRLFLFLGRLFSVAVLLALLWNPNVPVEAGDGSSSRYVILDGSASMTAHTVNGNSVWALAVTRARSLATGGARIFLSDGMVRPVVPDSLDALSPLGVESVLADAVGVAAEAGAREIVLVTDGRIADPVRTTSIARQLGVSLIMDPGVEAAAPNLGVSRLVLPGSVQPGRPVRGRVEVEGQADVDSVAVTVSVDDRPQQVIVLPTPEDGGVRGAAFTLPGALAAGARRVSARLEHRDAFPLDDERIRVVQVDPDRTGILLVSFSPDWEPRFLFPVLEQVTGLPVRGFLRTGPDRFHPMDAADSDPDGTIDRATLERLLGRAELVVAMGVDGSAGALLESATVRTRRLLVFPVDSGGAALVGVVAGRALAGAWYPSRLPPSPIVEGTGEFSLGDLPPLTGVLPVLDPVGGAALEVRRGGAGEARAALLLRSEGSRRVAVVLARGFWRWAFRDGTPRERYRRLWAAVGGWMMADEPLAAGPGVRPVAAVLPRGVPTQWQGWGYEEEEVRLSITGRSGAFVVDSVLDVPAHGRFTTPALPPGRYEYRVVMATDTAVGGFDVETFTGEMLQQALDPEALTIRGGGGAADRAGSRPFRTWSFPYLLILVVLCAEWVGRRRAGLR